LPCLSSLIVTLLSSPVIFELSPPLTIAFQLKASLIRVEEMRPCLSPPKPRSSATFLPQTPLAPFEYFLSLRRFIFASSPPIFIFLLIFFSEKVSQLLSETHILEFDVLLPFLRHYLCRFSYFPRVIGMKGVQPSVVVPFRYNTSLLLVSMGPSHGV